MDNSLEAKFELIDNIINDLAKDDIPLEKAIEEYAKAKLLIEDCKGTLDMVEKKVLKLNPDGNVTEFEDKLDF